MRSKVGNSLEVSGYVHLTSSRALTWSGYMYVADLPTMNGSRMGSRDFLMNLDEVLATHIAIDVESDSMWEDS